MPPLAPDASPSSRPNPQGGSFPALRTAIMTITNGRLGVERVKKSAAAGRGLPSPGGRSFLSTTQKGTQKVTALGTEAVVCPQCKTVASVLEASRNLQL